MSQTKKDVSVCGKWWKNSHEKGFESSTIPSGSGGYRRPAAERMLAGKTRREKKPSTEQVNVKVDSTKEDTMDAFYERMRRWDALHGGMRHKESEKSKDSTKEK